MALRRELLTASVLAAALLVLLPAAAMAAPRWLGGEPLEAPAGSAPRVAADANGNAVAIWLGAGGGVNAAYRPRGGPWGGAENLDPGTDVFAATPRVTVQPDGEFVAVWVAERGTGPSFPLRWARRPAGEGWSPPATIDGIGCCPGITALQASADGSVLVVATDEGTPQSNRRPPGSETWGPAENVGTESGTQVAVAPDGSAVAANTGSCGEAGCIRAAYRPPAGPWGPAETAALPRGANVTGLAVAAGPDSSYTVVWAENTRLGQATGPPGAVRSSDRSAGAGGVWDAAPTLVADLPDDSPGCPQSSFGCIDLATGGDGAQLAVWQQAGSFGDIVAGRLRSTDGDWSPGMERVGDTGAAATSVAAAITAGGVPVAAWPDRSGGVARAAFRGAPGTWVATPLGPAAGSVDLDDLAVDGDGNAVTAWTDPSGASAAGFDGGFPRINSISVPATGTAGDALAFSATADDAWSGVSISWLFGDGGSAAGSVVSHTYGAAGTFSARATATDGVGNASESTGSTAVAAAPDPCGTGDRDKDGIKDACDTNDGSRRPVAFKTVNATVVSGDVFIKLPAGAARAAQGRKPPKGFVRLQGANTIPVGSTLDTARGRVKLRSASDTRARRLQSASSSPAASSSARPASPRGKAKRRSTQLITVSA